MKIETLIKGAVPIVVGTVLTGLAFYYLGNLPGFKQAQLGINGTSAPLLG